MHNRDVNGRSKITREEAKGGIMGRDTGRNFGEYNGKEERTGDTGLDLATRSTKYADFSQLD